MSNPQTSPLTARLYDLEYPRSLGVYSTYAEVQTVVDLLADNEFPVQHTMIVGTDLKLIERVTGRKTWGRVIGNGVLSGLWMGLFMGLLFVLLTNQPVLMLLTTVIMGVIFFTVWSAVGYAASGGKRDFTSMTATIPMQYELMVEHTHAGAAREILAAHGTAVPAAPRRGYSSSPASPSAVPGGRAATGPAQGRYGQPAPGQGDYGQPAPGHGGYGRPAPGQDGVGASAPAAAPATGSGYGYGYGDGQQSPLGPDAAAPGPGTTPPRRPVYGRPADAPSPGAGDGIDAGPAAAPGGQAAPGSPSESTGRHRAEDDPAH